MSGNRNELLARPASTLARQDGILAPRDELQGGTWLGVNQHGVFVVLTNRRGAVVDGRRRSRGLLVRDALHARSARELHEHLEGLDGSIYNGFHLVYADLQDAFITWGDGARTRQLRLPAEELHVVTERSFGAGEALREQSVRDAYQGLEPAPVAWRPGMTTHAEAPLESACVHADAVGYGTRSSIQLVLRANGAHEGLWTDGHPCVSAPRDISEDLQQFVR